MLNHRGLLTVLDLLYYLPFRYEDRSNVKHVREVVPGEKVTVLARVESSKMSGFHRRALGMFEASLSDGSGLLAARWFNGKHLADLLTPGIRVALYGKIEYDRQRMSPVMVQPELEVLAENEEDENLHTGKIVPIYEAVGKISTRVFRVLLHRILEDVQLPDDALPDSVRKRLALPPLGSALRDVHAPPPDTDVRLLNEFRSPAQFRLIFDEFFWLECGLALKKSKARKVEGIAFTVTDRVREQIKRMLPFKPTGAQRRVIQEIADDMKQPHPMNRLLQGDVGSGKTIVAAQAAVIAIENGYQVAVLAPTEILAAQHFAYFKRLMEKLGYVAVLLKGSNTAREKTQLKELIASGYAHVAVGTHALIQEDVEFHKLGLAIVDEQHRFGVVQRFKLMEKGIKPDVLVMTATPIPRTLALTIYGDLDISIIDELPPGRQPIMTRQVPETAIEKYGAFVGKEIEQGRQAYVVYPVIEESETNAMKAAQKMHEHLSKRRVSPDCSRSAARQDVVGRERIRHACAFNRMRSKILVSTTVDRSRRRRSECDRDGDRAGGTIRAGADPSAARAEWAGALTRAIAFSDGQDERHCARTHPNTGGLN